MTKESLYLTLYIRALAQLAFVSTVKACPVHENSHSSITPHGAHDPTLDTLKWNIYSYVLSSHHPFRHYRENHSSVWQSVACYSISRLKNALYAHMELLGCFSAMSCMYTERFEFRWIIAFTLCLHVYYTVCTGFDKMSMVKWKAMQVNNPKAAYSLFKVLCLFIFLQLCDMST